VLERSPRGGGDEANDFRMEVSSSSAGVGGSRVTEPWFNDDDGTDAVDQSSLKFGWRSNNHFNLGSSYRLDLLPHEQV
jgi:hypothetical protein